MDTKTILTGLTGIIIGGLIVSIAASSNQHGSSMTMSAMTANVQNRTGDDFDKVFISEMIDHHQGAIEMAKLAAKHAKHPEVKSLANDILAAQSKEIDMMQTWQGEWRYKNVPSMQHPNIMQ